MEKTNLPESPSFVDLCTLHQHAMRYYRLWIYACNTVLAVATLVFTVFAVSVLVDPRISLISGVELYQPTFLYAYVALLLQCGVLQTIGCLGALRLNQKLLNTYWTLLLVLMIGDIVVGLIWAFRLDGIKDALKPNLKRRLETEYGRDLDFTQVWDWVQKHEMCCGIDGPSDFNNTADPVDDSHKYLPPTCCTLMTHMNSSEEDEDSKGRSSETRRSYSHNFQVGSPSTHPNPNANVITRRRIQSSRRQNNYESKTDGGGGGGKSPNLVGPGQSSLPHSTSQRYPNSPQQTTESSSSSSSQHSQSTANRFQEVCNIPPHLRVSDSINSISSTEMSFKSSHSTNKHTKLDSNNVLKKGGVLTSEESSAATFVNPTPRNVIDSTPMTLTGPSPSTTGISLLEILENQRRLGYRPHSRGCAQKILEWLDYVTDILFVIGFCIIVFLKGCFLAILRYEIKEMIQKIRLLNGEDAIRSATMNELIGLTSIYADPGSQGENGEGGGEGGSSAGRRSFDDSGGLLRSVSKRKCNERNTDRGNALLASVDTSLSNSNKQHYQPHIGNHVGHVKDKPDNVVEDDYDSSSALLGRFDARARGKDPSAPRTLPKNGNNNISANANISNDPAPPQPSMASSAP
ncbi:unnamed protein product [Allacma fusca]|uniref:Tetraspanin n=1 Tax=Allacma fusca TaxID=39272 RepID=A0A8J2KWL4_9HEXA|nr:unnamed protein product [Allacma fusca]